MPSLCWALIPLGRNEKRSEVCSFLISFFVPLFLAAVEELKTFSFFHKRERIMRKSSRKVEENHLLYMKLKYERKLIIRKLPGASSLRLPKSKVSSTVFRATFVCWSRKKFRWIKVPFSVSFPLAAQKIFFRNIYIPVSRTLSLYKKSLCKHETRLEWRIKHSPQQKTAINAK